MARLTGFFRAPDFDLELFAERVHATYADAMKAAGDFVGGGVELAAGVQLGEHDLHGGHALAVRRVHHVHGNAAAVVDHGDGVVHVDHDIDFLGVAGKRFVDRVVDDFVDEVVQPHLAGRADVHGGAQAHGFKAFKNFDVFAGVAVVVAVLDGGAAQSFSRHKFRSPGVAYRGSNRGRFRTLERD